MIEDIRLFGNVNAGNCFLILIAWLEQEDA